MFIFRARLTPGLEKPQKDSGRAYTEGEEGRKGTGCEGGIKREREKEPPIEPFSSSALSAPPQKKRDDTAEHGTGSRKVI